MDLIDWFLYAACIFGASWAGNMIAHRMYSERDKKRRIRAIELENKFRNDPRQKELEAELKAELKNVLNLIRQLNEQIERQIERNKAN